MLIFIFYLLRNLIASLCTFNLLWRHITFTMYKVLRFNASPHQPPAA